MVISFLKKSKYVSMCSGVIEPVSFKLGIYVSHSMLLFDLNLKDTDFHPGA